MFGSDYQTINSKDKNKIMCLKEAALSISARSDYTAGSVAVRARFRPSVLPFWTKNLGHDQIFTRLDQNEYKVLNDEMNIFGILEKYRIRKIVIENTTPQV